MSAKYTLASNTTAGDRLLNIGEASAQLSTGDLVMLVRDPSVADPNSITLQLVPGTAHTTPSVIATLNAVATLGTGSFLLGGYPQSLALCVDTSDNIYVVGCYGGVTGGGTTVVYQGFVKGVGLNWTPATANTCSSALTGSPTLRGFAAVWCNTNGIGGHLVVIANTNNATEGFFSLSASAILAGVGQHGTYVVSNPAFLGTGLAATSGSNIDLDTDGLGANSGMAVSSNSAGSFQVASWGVSATGVLTVGTGFIDIESCGALSTSTKLRIVRYAPQSFAVVAPSATNAGQLTVFSYYPSFMNGTVDTGTTSHFPAPSATLSWDVAAAAPIMEQVWIYGWSSLTATTMLRESINFSNGGVIGPPVLGSVVSDDTSVGSGAGNTTIRVVNDPVDFGHVDWQTNDVVTAFSLLGDCSAFPTAPNPPVITSPANNAGIALASGGTITWAALVSQLLNDTQTQVAFRRFSPSTLFQWWTGSGWTTGQAAPTGGNETYLTTANLFITFGSGQWTASATYQIAVSVVGNGSFDSAYSSVVTLTVLVAPNTPTLTATYDPVLNRTALVAQGSTATATVGSIEYSDDGGTTWAFVRGATAFTIYPGPTTLYDIEVGTQATRQYRARAWAPAPFNPSLYATASVVAPKLPSYNVIDVLIGTQISVLIKAGSPASTRNEPRTVHQPIGADFDLVVADKIKARQRTVTFTTRDPASRDALDTLLDLQRPLFYQSPIEASTWMRVTDVTTTEVQNSADAFITYFEHAVTFSQVGRPAP